MDSTERDVRRFILERFEADGIAPTAPEIAGALKIPLARTHEALDRLDATRHLKLLEGTHRILMAFPFSAIATPYRVTRIDGRRYFANCAWDAVAFHVMLEEAVRVDGYCDACAGALRVDLRDGSPDGEERRAPLVRLALPAHAWWRDITRTCANTMTFIGPEERDAATGRPRPDGPGVLTVRQVVELSRPLYEGRLRPDFERPGPDVLRRTFSDLGLTGEFWEL